MTPIIYWQAREISRLAADLDFPFDSDQIRHISPIEWKNMEGLMSEEYRKFDAADYIRTEEDARGLLRAATDEDLGDGVVIRAALKHAARTQNISALARDTGLNRGNLYEALSEDGNPTLATLLKVTQALGLRLRLEPVESPIQSAQPAECRNLTAGSTST